MARVAKPQRGALPLFGFVAVSLTASLANALPVAPDDIRDIRGPIPIPLWWRWPLAIALAAVAAFALVLLVRGWRARRSRALSPIERSRRALAAAETYAREGRSHEWADLVAETLRGALAARLGIDVLPQTTGELSKAPWAKPPLSVELDAARVLELLETCDLARFAKARLDASALLSLTAIAGEVVERLFAPPARPTTIPAPFAPMVTP